MKWDLEFEIKIFQELVKTKSKSVLWAKFCPQNSYVEDLIPITSECDYMWRKAFKGGD